LSARAHWVVRAKGHPEIRGTHTRALELTPDAEIGKAATCIIGVGAEVPADLALARGPLRLTFSADGHTSTLLAWRSPSWSSTNRLVVRTSTYADGDTFAIGATAAASELERGLLDALSGGAPLRLDLHQLEPSPPLVVAARDDVPLDDLPAGLRAHLVAAARAGRLVGLQPPGSRRQAAWWAELRARPISSLDGALGGSVVVASASERLLLAALESVDDARRSRFRLLIVDPPHPGAALLLLDGRPATPAVSLGRLHQRPLRRRRLLAEALATGLPVSLDVPEEEASTLTHEVDHLAPGARLLWSAPTPDFGLALEAHVPAHLGVPPSVRRVVLLSDSSPRQLGD